MPLSSTTAAYTLIGMAEKFQDFFYNGAADVTFSYKDINGNIQTKTVPNIAKVTANLLANGVTDTELSNELTNYYTTNGVDGLITALRNEVNNNIETAKSQAISSSNAYTDSTTGIMSKAEFEANCEINRSNFACSGQYDSVGSFYNLILNETVSPNYFLRTRSYTDFKLVNQLVGSFGCETDGYVDRNYSPIFNINGVLINLRGTATGLDSVNEQPYVFKFPDVKLPPVIDDSTVMPLLKQGDQAFLEPDNRELWNINFTQATNAENTATIVDNNDGSFTYNTNGELSNRAWYFINPYDRFDAILNMEYILTFDYDVGTYTGNIIIGQFNVPYISKTVKDGKVELIFRGRKNIAFYFLADTPGASDDIVISNFSLKQYRKTSAIITALTNTTTEDIYTQPSDFALVNTISRVDLMFLETWHEDISEKGVVYPLGNTQYRAGDSDGVSGISDGTFTGKESYSKFGEWQDDDVLVGQCYIWNNLSDTDKAKFAGNPLNNIYKDNDKIIQVRYRVRVIKGLGNNWYSMEWSDYYNTLAYDDTTTRIRAIGKRYGITDYVGNSIDTWNAKSSDAGVYSLWFTGNISSITYGDRSNSNALPLLKVQRRNPGIFHPRYNPDGCAKIYYDNTDKYFYEIPLSFISSMEDCFNKDNIAVRNDADGGTMTLTSLEADVTNTTHFITGSVRSGVSGRID